MSRSLRFANLLTLAVLLSSSVSTAALAGFWPMFRHDPYHTGRTDAEGPSTGDICWKTALGGSIKSSPVVVSDRIYVTAGGYLRALDKDGNELWSGICPTSGDASPAVGSDGTIYAASSDAGLYAYRPDGSLLWKRTLAGPTEASPTVGGDGTVYIGCNTGKFYAYSAEGIQKYTYQAGGAISSSAAIASDGTVYFGCNDGYLYALRSNLQWKWKFPTNQMQPVKSSPAVGSDGTIYFGTMPGLVYAVSSTGGQKWQYSAGSAVVSSPALGSDGSIYFGCRDRYFYSISSMGKLQWKYSVGQYIDSSPAIDSNGTIYVGANNGSAYAFQPNGDLMWTTYAGGGITSSPAIGESGSLYLGTTEGFLCSIGNAMIPPTTPVVTDNGAYSTSPSSLQATWTATDEKSGIAKYEYAIGTYPGGEDLIPFTDAGVANGVTRTGLALLNGAQYYFSVRATNNLGLVSEIGISDGIIVDHTPPTIPSVVDDGSFTGSSDALHFIYSSSDSESAIERYEYSIGTAPGSQDIHTWTNAGSIIEQTVTGLSLLHGKSYYINVRASNNAGLAVEGYSDGILVDLTAPVVESITPTMTSSEVRVKLSCSDPESGLEEIQCTLLNSPQIPSSPDWMSGTPGSEAVIPGPFDPKLTYYIAARARNGVDRWSDVTMSAGVHLDNTPPSTPVVIDDGAFQCDQHAIHAAWSCSDPGSGLHHYSYCMGTMPGLANVVDWTNTSETSVVRSGLILTNGGTYYVTVRAANGVGLISTDGYSDGITIDITPPTKPAITDDGDFTSASDNLHAAWTASDAESGIADYSYCVGTAPGACDLLPWTSSGGKDSVTIYGLTLDPNIAYYFSVKARNGGGCWGEVGSSNGIRYSPGASVWPKFRCDNRNSGCSNRNACITGRLRWQVRTQGYVESSPAIGSDGTAYIGASDGRLYAINSNAAVRWTFQTGACIESSPAIGADGCIYVGSHDGYLYCVYPNGTQKWKTPAGGMIWSSPVVGSDGTIYFGCHDCNLYALYPDGRLKWKYKSGGAIWSSPALAEDGTLYFGCGDGRLYAVRSDGTLKWRFNTGSAIDSSPAVDESGAIYFGSGDGYFYALYPNGNLWWKYQTGRVTDSSPVITSDGRVCFGTGAIGTAGEIFSLTLTGQMVWRLSVVGGVRSSPAACADGTIYVGSADGTIFAIAPDGTTIWNYHTGQSILGSPAIMSDGSVVVGSDDGQVYSFRDFGGIDVTGPSEPRVRTAKVYVPPDAPISASWTAMDLESGVQGYSYAIGTAPGSGDVVGWTSVGAATSIKRSDLSLQLGRTYYVSVVASNYASLQSPVGVSSGITVVSGNTLNTIGTTRKRLEGTRVYLPGKTVAAVYSDCLFIEEVDRSSGIRCAAVPTGVAPGSVVNVLGTVTLRNGEEILTDPVIELCGFSFDVKPLMINARTMTSSALLPWGMLVRMTGRVISTGPDYAVFDDGSGKSATVLLDGQKPSIGDQIAVTGIVCMETVDQKPTVVIRPTSASPPQLY